MKYYFDLNINTILTKEISKEEMKKLEEDLKNDYKTNNQYTSTNPDALATGDAQGKGTGGFLDTSNQNAGAIQDVLERNSEIVVNKYKQTKTRVN